MAFKDKEFSVPPRITSDAELAFIRGYTDGDGCICVRDVFWKYTRKDGSTVRYECPPRLQIVIVGVSESVIRWIQATMDSRGISGRLYHGVGRDGNKVLWRLEYCDKSGEKFGELVYPGSAIALPRKKAKLTEYKMRREEHARGRMGLGHVEEGT